MPPSLTFHGDLPDLLHRRWRGRQRLIKADTRRASVKDVIESFGLPHTEVGRLEVQGRQVDFSLVVGEDLAIEIFPILPPWNVFDPTLLRPRPLTNIKFIVDVNVGKLARFLRMAGFDTLYDHRWKDDKLVALSCREQRILLTRDLSLLQRKQVEFGRYIRALCPNEQLLEVIGLLGLERHVVPFSRCMVCNTPLQPIAKEKIKHRLQPLTRKYYNSFSRCPGCRRIYWPGSHLDGMRQLLPAGPAAE